MQQIAPDVYTFTGLMIGRVYLLHDPDGLTLIDASLPVAGPKILDQIGAQGWQPDQVKRILITHAHPDHIGALAYLQTHTPAQVIASAPERDVIEGKAAIQRPASGFSLPAGSPQKVGSVDQVVKEGDSIPALGGLEVIGTPGHALGHIAFWQPEKRILFCGDTMMNMLGGLSLPFAAFTPDMPEAIRSIAKVAKLDLAITCFGHGVPVMGAESIRAFARRVSGA